MTTPEAARAYEAEHQRRWDGAPVAIYNPQERPVEELPVIYGFNNGGSRDMWSAVLLAEDGVGLGAHLCSSEAYMPHDLGVLEGSRPDRHETFRKHYPNGYRMEFVPGSKVREHAGLMEAYRKNQERHQGEGL